MPWTPLMLITVLFGLICGNRLVENRLRNIPSYVLMKNAGDQARSPSASIKTSNSKNDYYDSTQKSSIAFATNAPSNSHSLRRNFLTGFYGLADDCRDTKLKLRARRELSEAPPLNDREGDSFAHRELVNTLGVNDALFALAAPTYADLYEDLLEDMRKEDAKRVASAPNVGCDCKIKNDLLDLGQEHFPRYLLNAVCQTDQSPNELPQKCWHGTYCKPLEYKVKVLTFRTLMDHALKDPALAWLPDDLRQLWKFKTVTVAAGCFCSY